MKLKVLISSKSHLSWPVQGPWTELALSAHCFGSCSHNAQKMLVLGVCLNGCVCRWELNHLSAPLSQKKMGKNEKQSSLHLYFPGGGGCAAIKLNTTQRTIRQRSIYTNIIPKVCFHVYLDLGISETRTTHADSESFPAVVKCPWVDTSNTF